jgi:hypothetical protein
VTASVDRLTGLTASVEAQLTVTFWRRRLIYGDATSKRFMKNLRQYNCLFTSTSMGTNVDRSMNDGHGPLVFKICDQIHHRIGSLLPPDGRPPKFIQLYIYDTTNEISTVQTTLSVQSWKPFQKTYLEVSKNYETMHIHSSSMDVHYSKSWETKSI